MARSLDYDALQESFVFLLVLAFFIERSLAVVFELRLWRGPLSNPGVKELVAVAVSYAVCTWAEFDAFATLFNKDSVFLSKALNALLVAGGSKGAMKLMQDVLGVRKDVMENNIDRRKNRVNYEENVNLKVTKTEE
ncbi:uncharacterized protein ACA1_060560 [Acanthamoeba castellanii str. Neff]|uniref:Membrane protein n=1 Tax=Acanthamoeba castellanii (strain ATCC 30010 / Neff) TaxID=1257118 RepID=L8GVQ9_ACACF|nr:uncharacterized protein ACA1_060560 [Acanthamoeba castellanii str. Neff]ELR17329.1 membrane protein [Acanthamoeba castellanii str. Neff]